MDVLIFAGQSNMQGEAESRPIIQPIKNAYEYYHKSKKLIPLNHPVGEYIYDENGVFLLGQATDKNGSLVPAFCKEYLKLTQTDGVVAISTACGNTTISEWQKGTKRYDIAIDKIKSGIEKAKELGEIGKIYFVWFQGESDAYKQTPPIVYFELMNYFKNDLKKEISFDKFCIIKTGYFASVCEWCKKVIKNKHGRRLNIEELKALDNGIMSAQEGLIDNDQDFVMLYKGCPTLSLNKENMNPFVDGHYNAKTLDLIGRKAARTLAKLNKV